MKKFVSIKTKIVYIWLIFTIVFVLLSTLITNQVVFTLFFNSISKNLYSHIPKLQNNVEEFLLNKTNSDEEIKNYAKKFTINKVVYIYHYSNRTKSKFFYLEPSIENFGTIIETKITKSKKIKFLEVGDFYIINILQPLNNELGYICVGHNLSYLKKIFSNFVYYRIIILLCTFFVLIIGIFLSTNKVATSLKQIYEFLQKITTTTTERLNLNTNDETNIIASYINQFLDTIQKNTVSITKLEQEIDNHKKTKELLSYTIQAQQIIIKMLLNLYQEEDLKSLSSRIVENLSNLQLISTSTYYDINLFLISEKEPETLELISYKNSDNSPPHCTKVKFGECFCGKAIIKKDITFDTHYDPVNCKHKIKVQHYHFCVPLISKEKVLGLLEISFIPIENYELEIQNLKFITTIILNIIEQKILQKEKKFLETKLLQQSKLSSLGQLAAGVAHELNNPLTVILGNTQHLLEENPSEELKDIESAAKRMQKIVSNLLEFSRQKDYIFERVDIEEIIENSLTLVGRLLEKNNIKIHKSYTKNIIITASKPHLEQVFVNLFTNSAKFMPQGGELFITTKIENNTVVIEIKDTGIGIPKENLEHLMEPFFTTDVHQGTGLGLSICNEIIKKHNGEIHIFSEGINKGTEVKIILPINKV